MQRCEIFSRRETIQARNVHSGGDGNQRPEKFNAPECSLLLLYGVVTNVLPQIPETTGLRMFWSNTSSPS